MEQRPSMSPQKTRNTRKWPDSRGRPSLPEQQGGPGRGLPGSPATHHRETAPTPRAVRRFKEESVILHPAFPLPLLTAWEKGHVSTLPPLSPALSLPHTPRPCIGGRGQQKPRAAKAPFACPESQACSPPLPPLSPKSSPAKRALVVLVHELVLCNKHQGT